MLHCYLALTVSQERCCHLPLPLFGAFAETHLSGGKELRVEVHTEENKKVEGGKKNKGPPCLHTYGLLIMQKLLTALYILIEVVTQICERAVNIFYATELLAEDFMH